MGSMSFGLTNNIVRSSYEPGICYGLVSVTACLLGGNDMSVHMVVANHMHYGSYEGCWKAQYVTWLPNSV